VTKVSSIITLTSFALLNFANSTGVTEMVAVANASPGYDLDDSESILFSAGVAGFLVRNDDQQTRSTGRHDLEGRVPEPGNRDRLSR